MTNLKGIEGRFRALCDNGSQVNLITQAASQALGLKPEKHQTQLVGIGGRSLGSSVGEVMVAIKLRDKTQLKDIFYIVKEITTYAPNVPRNKFWSMLDGPLADEHYNQPGKIDALLGAGIWIRIIQQRIIREPTNQGIAQQTKIGYVLFENRRDPYQAETPYIGAISKGSSIQRLHDLIQQLWETEEIPQTKLRTKEETDCEEIFIKGHSRTQNGRYIVRMPVRETIQELGRSKRMALHQFFAMEGKMRRNREFAERYKMFMSEYETLGHMRQIQEAKEEGYYTPHHGVLSSNKFRVVFNASAKTTTGISLNETQLVGEKLQQDLFLTLINFRRFRYGITADIEKMYRQILMHPDDRKYQKILWRPTEAEPVRVYELNTVTYGHACAPHCAIRTLIQCARDNEAQSPRGARIIQECFYVDDLLTGAHTQQDVERLRSEVSSILEKGKMRLTKWKTNGEFFEKVQLGEKQGDEENSKVLGLCWNLRTDEFFYKVAKSGESSDYMWTKRRVLSKIGKMYDPNGYVGPVIMTGKMIIQELWRDKLDWDQEITGPLKKKWKTFNEDLVNIETIRINRWLGTTEGNEIELHGFCDASEKGYGAVLYSRVKERGKFRIEIIASKSKVAPLKTLTIPRLELCAASLLANLIKVISPKFSEGKVRIFGWTDSQIVLHWLTKPSANLKTYVANRVANIQEKSRLFNINWYWISGLQNPADLISRGTTAMELNRETKWWKGPDWLKEREAEWPEQPKLTTIIKDPEAEKELRAIHLVTPKQEELIRGKWFRYDRERQKTFPLLAVYGEWNKLWQVTATLFRACHNFKNPRSRKIGNLSQEELEGARTYLIQLDQKTTFEKEITTTKENQIGTVANLTVIWDKEMKLLRIDGRIRSQNLTKDEQFPIIISKQGYLAKLLIRDAHFKTGHGGNQLMLQYLRTKYWIMGARQMAKNVTRQCPICFRFRMKTSEQLMATLPTIRTTPSRPFSKVGVDYAGPVMLRSALGRNPRLIKAYIAVFICLVTRAIHVELVSDDTTEAFIAALRRMIARRGMISEIISDNAKNFVGANNYLRSIMEEQEKTAPQIEKDFGLKWRFITPNAPHHGGIYEAAVKSIKHHLKRIIGETTLTFEEYNTILTQAESYVNSRPLCAISEDPTDLTALTPGHFLIGGPLVRIPDNADYRETNENRLNRWEHLQKMLQHFWDRWRNEYLDTLINRSKWTNLHRNIKVGDLVIERENNTPPLKWKLARIQEVLPGKDELVRSVILRNSKGTYQRPITKLGVLYSPEDE